ncbi:PAS domain-containing protein [bacterium]|nr:PAS domain-containing protein [bacterium]
MRQVEQAMQAILKILGIAAGLTAVLGGALLSMGHLRSAESDFADLEVARVKNLASAWETRLLGVRAAFRDQLLRQDGAAFVEHPAEWASWRVTTKFDAMQTAWPMEIGRPKGWALLRTSGDVHAAAGDTSGLGAVVEAFGGTDATDIALASRESGRPSCLGIQYSPPADDIAPNPGRLVALFDPGILFDIPNDPPAHWVLMNSPRTALMASARRQDLPIGQTTWNILLSETSGLISMDDGLPLAFCRIHVPGMQPLLVVAEIESPVGAGSATGALLLLAGGTAWLVFALLPRRKKAAVTTGESPEADESGKDSAVTVTFRQIFHALHTPLCVVDRRGRILRVNAAARELLRLKKDSQINEDITVLGGEFRGALKEFLAYAIRPEFQGGCFLLCEKEAHYFDGEIRVSLLSGGTSAEGPAVIEFLETRPVANGDRTAITPVVSEVDALNPNPLMLVDREFRVAACNKAALDANVKLASAPYLWDVIPGIERSEFASLLDPRGEARFESLFGSQVHEFKLVHTDSGTLLYASRKSSEQTLQVALNQAQENFNVLCSLSGQAVLLVDPRTHVVLDANYAASDLFGVVHPSPKGRNLDDFGDWPWEEESLRDSIPLTREDSSVAACRIEHELIKIEGQPTLLVLMSSAEVRTSEIRELADHAESMIEEVKPAPVEPAMPMGPGMLIVTNPTVRDVARRMIEHTGRECEVFITVDDATAFLFREGKRPEFVMIDPSDFDEPHDLIQLVRHRCGDVPYFSLGDSAETPACEGANFFLNKPFELEEISEAFLAAGLPSVSTETANPTES